MYTKYDYPPINTVGEVNNDAGSLEIVSASTGMKIHINKIVMSVHEPAVGGGGKLRVQDTLGSEIFTIDANSVKEFEVNFGEPEGYEMDRSVGIHVIVYGATIENASASVAISGYKSFQ